MGWLEVSPIGITLVPFASSIEYLFLLQILVKHVYLQKLL